MNNLLSFKFWLTMRPPLLLPIYQKIFFLVIIIFVLLTIISWVLQKKKNIYNKIWNRVNNFSISNVIFGLIFLFFNYELIPFFSSRFWFLVWGLVIIIWSYFLFNDFRKIPIIKKEREKEKEFKKYIP